MKKIPKCRFCKSSEINQYIIGQHVYGGKKNQHFWKCKKCEMVYLFPFLDEKKEKKFYENKFENFMSIRSNSNINWKDAAKHYKSNKNELERRSKFIDYNKFKNKKILEIGCSSGFMLHSFKKVTKHLYCVEPSRKFHHFLINKNIKIFHDYDEILLNHEGTFDFIIHYYVLEHINNPLKFLNILSKLLKKGGQMIFEVPNVNDPLITIYNTPQFEKFYWSVVHHWYYSPKTISKLLNKTEYKYKIYLDQRYDLSNHIIWLKEGEPGGLNRFKNVFDRNTNQQYRSNLIRSGYCDTIGVILKKI